MKPPTRLHPHGTQGVCVVYFLFIDCPCILSFGTRSRECAQSASSRVGPEVFKAQTEKHRQRARAHEREAADASD